MIFVDEQIWLDMYTGGLLHMLLTRAHSYVDQRFMVNHFMVRGLVTQGTSSSTIISPSGVQTVYP
jgi:hypothetical protein